MAHEKILIVEDDPDIAEMIVYNLGKEGYVIDSSRNGEHAVARAQDGCPDIIILDIMLPGMDGMEVCRALKQDAGTHNIPIIMLSAKSQETDKVVCLELGADDYITKPFSPRELIARIRAVLRRGRPLHAGDTGDSHDIGDTGQVMRSNELEIDILKHRVTVSGKEIALTSTEFRLLEYMARKPGEALSRQNILDSVFGYSSDVYDRTVDTHIKTLRKKLGHAKSGIETVRGVGYRFRETMD